jgi:aspartate aminotransferase
LKLQIAQFPFRLSAQNSIMPSAGKLGLLGGLYMSFSRRILSVQPSPTLALNAKAVQLSKQGFKVLNFAVGEPDYPTPSIVVDRAIESLRAGRTR